MKSYYNELQDDNVYVAPERLDLFPSAIMCAVLQVFMSCSRYKSKCKASHNIFKAFFFCHDHLSIGTIFCNQLRRRKTARVNYRMNVLMCLLIGKTCVICIHNVSMLCFKYFCQMQSMYLSCT